MAGNMKFSHAVGYRGLCSITPNGGKATPLLCTGGNINLTQDPIMSGGVWGAGYANAAPIAYAFNYLSLEGSINFEWVNNKDVWEALQKFAFTDRTEASTVHMLPDGVNGFHGDGWCSSISFEASEGAALTGSMNFKGDPSDEAGGIVSDDDVLTLGIDKAQKLGTSSINRLDGQDQSDKLKFGTGYNGVNLAGATLIPYWNTKVSTYIKGQGFVTVDDVINWSCSYNSDLQVLKCCSYQKNLNEETNTPIGADYILCGEMSGEGSLTVFALRESGACSFAPTGFHTRKNYLTSTLGGFQDAWDITSNDTGTPMWVTVPNALINSGSTAMATGASYITCDYSFTAIGDGVNSVVMMSGKGNTEATPSVG